MADISELQIKAKVLALGFHKVGFVNLQATLAPIQGNDTADEKLRRWLAQSHHASMDWMTDARRQSIQSVMPEAKSVISVAMNYYTSHPRVDDSNVGKISRYGWGRDYHKVLTKRLKVFSRWLDDAGVKSRFYVDTGPIQEKPWAQQAGLGWVGKHGNLITRDYGSWVFLAEILTDLALKSDQPHLPHCGSCTRCIDACPTQAIVEPFVVDANRCIAYHTIENRANSIPQAIAEKMDGWVAGCDICQDVCPWNMRFAKVTEVPDFQPYPWNINPSLDELADLSEEEWDCRFRASALRRIRVDMMRRNAKANLELQSDNLGCE